MSNLTNPSVDKFTDLGYPSTAYLVTSSALVFLMIPGLGLFYGGLAPMRHSLTLMLTCLLSIAVVTLQWVLWGFSLSFSETSKNGFIGNFQHAGFSGLGANALLLTAPAVPSTAFALYQLQFACITMAIVFGSVAGRIRMGPAILFMFLWTTFVYDFVAYWTFSARGWLKNLACLNTVSSTPCLLGGLDFAGRNFLFILKL